MDIIRRPISPFLTIMDFTRIKIRLFWPIYDHGEFHAKRNIMVSTHMTIINIDDYDPYDYNGFLPEQKVDGFYHFRPSLWFHSRRNIMFSIHMTMMDFTRRDSIRNFTPWEILWFWPIFTIMDFTRLKIWWFQPIWLYDEFHLKKNSMILTHMTIMDFTRTES